MDSRIATVPSIEFYTVTLLWTLNANLPSYLSNKSKINANLWHQKFEGNINCLSIMGVKCRNIKGKGERGRIKRKEREHTSVSSSSWPPFWWSLTLPTNAMLVRLGTMWLGWKGLRRRRERMEGERRKEKKIKKKEKLSLAMWHWGLRCGKLVMISWAMLDRH